MATNGKKNVKYFWGGPAFSPLKWGQPGEITTPWLLMTPLFISNSFHTVKMRMFTKYQRGKYSVFSTNDEPFCAIKNFIVEPQNFLKLSYLPQFWKFLSILLHMISNFTYQKATNSNRVFLAVEGPPPKNWKNKCV